jgi:hypothetical protein
MLCEAMVILEKYMGPVAMSKECSQQLLDWWRRHQQSEEDRVREEAAAKLTDLERLALGIDERGQNTRTRLIRSRK